MSKRTMKSPGTRFPVVRPLTRHPNRRLAAGVVLGVMAAACAVGLMATSAWLIVTAAGQPPVLTLMVAIVAVRAFGIGRGAFRYAERLVTHDAAYRMLADTRAGITRQLEPLAPADLANRRSGDLLARLVLDVDSVLDRWLRVILPITVAGITATATVVLITALLPAAGVALALAVVTALTAVPWLVARTARRAEQSMAGARGDLAAAITETVQTAPDLIAFGATGRALAEVGKADDRLRDAERRSAWSSGLGAALLMVCVGGASVAGLVAARHGDVGGTVLAVVVLTPLALADVLGGVPAAAQIAVRTRAALARVNEIASTRPAVTEPAAPNALPAKPPAGRTLTVRGLRASYGDGPDVLDGIDLDIPAGEWTVATGPSGSGKYTLAAVLMRFLDPRAGQVQLDGVDITTLAGDDVRTVIGLMTQESYVFDTSIEENLRIARPAATGSELRAALAAARLPLDPATTVGEHGARLSGGERQRLALARMLLAGFDILILDEPTEHLDEPTARALLRDLYATTSGRTVLLLTHRPEQTGVTPTPLCRRAGGEVVSAA
jgi:ATP-binding cassette, subfamily C, bacterial CydC